LQVEIRFNFQLPEKAVFQKTLSAKIHPVLCCQLISQNVQQIRKLSQQDVSKYLHF